MKREKERVEIHYKAGILRKKENIKKDTQRKEKERNRESKERKHTKNTN